MDVFVFPDYRCSNPYQTLYYGDLGRHVAVRYRSIDEVLLIQATSVGGAETVFHLHWEDAIYRNAANHAEAWDAAKDFVAKLAVFMSRRGRFVWTMHNEMPHDGLHLDVHAWLVAALSGHADALQVHSRAAADHLAISRGLDPDKLIVTRHGNFLGWYDRWPDSQRDARRRLGLPENQRILLLFGRLGTYKGTKDALSCWHRLDAPEASLIIAGKQIDPIFPDGTIPPENVIVLDRFIDDNDIPPLFAAADFVLAPYRRSMTSGTVVLALSMGRPVVAPRLFHIAEIVDDEHSGFLYDPQDPSDLSRQLRRSVSIPCTAEMNQNARTAGERLDWSENTDSVLGLYRFLSQNRRGRLPRKLGR